MELIVSNAEELETAERCLELARNYDIVRAALGIHPEYALRLPFDVVSRVEELIQRNDEEVVAVGEIGLDYKFAQTREEKDRQKEFFVRQIELANQYSLPVEVHSRRAHRPVLDLLEAHADVPVVLHWFSGGLADVLRGVELGYYFSFGPAIIHYEAYVPIVEAVPLDRILLETDGPVRFKGRPAEPCDVGAVAERIASIKKTSIENVMEAARRNARRLFHV